ncbi:MAG: Hpt domain-containing protein [Gammaproteobacteria bacterium]|jgi:HPt (histidine-containing phosphotransfer) domain-containing protein|nr:Hpt domain-containing protein [Gammaproteobacteria bacterium]
MTETAIDTKIVLSLKKLFNEGFDDFIALYFSDFETKERELYIYVRKSELEAARKIAHALKGNSINVGAIDLAKRCEDIEVAIKNGKEPQIIDACENLQKIYPQFKTAYLNLTSTI